MGLFTDHPNSVGETYWQHMAFAVRFGRKCFMAALYAFTHALFPFLYTKNASKIILELADLIEQSKRAQPPKISD